MMNQYKHELQTRASHCVYVRLGLAGKTHSNLCFSLLLVILILFMTIQSCHRNQYHDLTGKLGRFWLIKDTSSSIRNDDNYETGMLFNNNGTGLFYSKSNGIEQLQQPNLFDSSPTKLVDCFFIWSIDNDTLFVTQHGSYTVKYNIEYINDRGMGLINNNQKVQYVSVRDIE